MVESIVIAFIVGSIVVVIGCALAYGLFKIRTTGGLKSGALAGIACAIYAILGVLRNDVSKDKISLNQRSNKKSDDSK